MENEKHFFDKISDYYSGDDDQMELKKELEADSEGKEIFHWVDRFWNAFHPEKRSVDRIKKRTYSRIEETDRVSQNFWVKTMKYAAIFVFVFMVGGVTYYLTRTEVKMLKTVSGVGQVKEVLLPDGSKAWLNAQSEITYPERFAKDVRRVNVLGEVYFEVQHDEQHPFVVNADCVVVRVLGTSFMVSNYANEPDVNTYLAKGSVELEFGAISQTMKMIPGDEVTYEKATSHITKIHNPQSSLDLWRFGGISFYGESLNEIARKLERKFGTEVKIGSEKVGEMKFSCDFDTESIDQILQFLSESSQIKYKKTTTGYILTEK